MATQNNHEVNWSYEACAKRATEATDSQLLARLGVLDANYHLLSQDEWRQWRAYCDEFARRREQASDSP